MKAKRRTNKSRSKKHYNRTQKRSNKMNRKTYRRTNKRTKRINRRTRRTRRNNRKKGGAERFRRLWRWWRRAAGAADQDEIERFCLWSAEYVPEDSWIRGHIPGEYGPLLDYFKTFERPLSELPELVRQDERGRASDRWHELFEINVERFLDNQTNGTDNPVLRFGGGGRDES